MLHMDKEIEYSLVNKTGLTTSVFSITNTQTFLVVDKLVTHATCTRMYACVDFRDGFTSFTESIQKKHNAMNCTKRTLLIFLFIYMIMKNQKHADFVDKFVFKEMHETNIMKEI